MILLVCSRYEASFQSQRAADIAPGFSGQDLSKEMRLPREEKRKASH